MREGSGKITGKSNSIDSGGRFSARFFLFFLGGGGQQSLPTDEGAQPSAEPLPVFYLLTISAASISNQDETIIANTSIMPGSSAVHRQWFAGRQQGNVIFI